MSVTTGIVAHSGGGNADATVLKAGFNVVATCAAHMDSVILSNEIGTAIVRNDGAKDCAVFPPAGAAIDSLAADAAYPIASGSLQEFVPVSATQWYTKNHGMRLVHIDYVEAVNAASATMNATWVTLDISSIVPPSAIDACLMVEIRDDTVGAVVYSRTGGGGSPGLGSPTNPSNGGANRSVMTTPIAANGTIDYYCSTALTTFTLGVQAYWVEG